MTRRTLTTLTALVTLGLAPAAWAHDGDDHDADEAQAAVAGRVQGRLVREGQAVDPALASRGHSTRAGPVAFRQLEGEGHPRNVVIEFPDYAAALTCYNSPEYRQNMKIRQANAITNLVIVEGYDGPQPTD